LQRHELTRLAEICLRHNLVICADEVHCDLVLQGHPHLPIASLAPEIAARTITLMAPSKTYNLAGLKCAFAIIPNASLREKVLAARVALVHGIVSLLGSVAALAA
jgi:cystathionine beta-lyase